MSKFAEVLLSGSGLKGVSDRLPDPPLETGGWGVLGSFSSSFEAAFRSQAGPARPTRRPGPEATQRISSSTPGGWSRGVSVSSTVLRLGGGGRRPGVKEGSDPGLTPSAPSATAGCLPGWTWPSRSAPGPTRSVDASTRPSPPMEAGPGPGQDGAEGVGLPT